MKQKNEIQEKSPPGGSGKKKITRRFFLVIFLGAVIGLFAWFYRRNTTSRSIQAFFDLEDKQRNLIQEELDLLKKEHVTWFFATVGFFSFVDWGLRFLIPRRIEFRVINYWSWRIFSRRSIAWEYVNYPRVGDDPICDGLIRPSEQ